MALQFDADDQELALFLAETNAHLQSLDQDIVSLESRPDDQQLLQSIFRSAHTIKGGAGLIGHARMAQLAHAMENVLDALRARTLAVTPLLIDTLLVSLDGLRVLNDEVVTRAVSPLDVDELLAALAACQAGGSQPAAPAPASAALPAPTDGAAPEAGAWELDEELDRLISQCRPGSTFFDVAVAIDPDCGLSAARTLQSALDLGRTCRILRMLPSRQQIEEDESSAGFRALVVTDEVASLLEERLGRGSDVLEARVTAATLQGRDQQPETAAAPRAAGRPSVPGMERAVAPETSIRISVGILDDLMSLVSELVLGRTRLQTLRTQLHERYSDDEQVVQLEDAVGHLDRISTELQTTVMKARMLPVENIFNKFPRLMRDLAAHTGKQISFTMSGQETELDRSVLEQLSDPLIHLLRNAIDHGMETPGDRQAAGKAASGAITLAAAPAENHILITVSDDGRGIDAARLKASAVVKGQITAEAAERMSDREAIELVFLPGVSTAKQITNISGRGVGMDIVKSAIERMGGHIQIESSPGVGTTFSITLPLTLAIMQALLVQVDATVYALPLNTVTEILTVAPTALHHLQGTEATLLRGSILPLVRLRAFFGGSPAPMGPVLHIVATRVDGQLLGLVVDRFLGEQEIVMKPLGGYLGQIPGIAGATILGDGRIGLLVDVAALRDGASVSRARAS